MNHESDQFRPQIEQLSRRARRQLFRKQGGKRFSMASSMFGNAFGAGAAVETFEQAFTWGPVRQFVWAGGNSIYSGALDPTNTPTTNLRQGLVMGIVTSTEQWTNYNPAATDGSQVAVGVLTVGLVMLDFITQTAQTKMFGMMVGGQVQASKLIGLDLMARAQMSPRFLFDDFINGISPTNYRFPWTNFVSKTASYSVVASDNFTLFDNTGATGAITFTLPAIANGYCFAFRVQADQNVIVASAEGANMIALNNAVANSVAFSTGSQKIGGQVIVYSNPGATKWIVETASAGANTVTVA